jgi:hypothetical protein
LEPFYIMVFVAGLVAASFVFHLLHLVFRPRRTLAFERREGFLPIRERLCLGTVEEAVGRDFRVFTRVAARYVLAGHRQLGWRTRRRADQLLGGLSFDLLVCAAADAHPLCGVVTEDEEGASRQRRREQSQLKVAAADAGFPTVSIKLQDGYELSAIRRSLIDAIETSEVRVKHDTPEPAEADEESLLADLAAAMQDPDSARGPERFVARR